MGVIIPPKSSRYNAGLCSVSLAGWPVACLKRSKNCRNVSGNHPKDSTMVVIRLSRGGAKGRPFFNIVVADKRVRRDGSFIERVGFYNPSAKGGEESLRLVQDRITYWKSVGAQASPTVDRLIRQAGKQAA
jgi:small subunit ribosomal protein S16